MKMLVGTNLEDEKLKKIVKKTIADADAKGDGKLNFDGFASIVGDGPGQLTVSF